MIAVGLRHTVTQTHVRTTPSLEMSLVGATFELLDSSCYYFCNCQSGQTMLCVRTQHIDDCQLGSIGYVLVLQQQLSVTRVQITPIAKLPCHHEWLMRRDVTHYQFSWHPALCQPPPKRKCPRAATSQGMDQHSCSACPCFQT